MGPGDIPKLVPRDSSPKHLGDQAMLGIKQGLPHVKHVLYPFELSLPFKHFSSTGASCSHVFIPWQRYKDHEREPPIRERTQKGTSFQLP